MLLDEPTAALASDEIHFLQDLLMKVKDQSAVVFVSHRLSELLDWSDRIIVFKDGRMITEKPAADLTEEGLHFLMVGRERDDQFYKEHRQREPEDAEPTLELTGLTDGTSFRDVDLTIRRGEIVGIAGVLGSGKSNSVERCSAPIRSCRARCVTTAKRSKIRLRRMRPRAASDTSHPNAKGRSPRHVLGCAEHLVRQDRDAERPPSQLGAGTLTGA